MIRQGFKWQQKPPLGYGLDLSHPFAAGGSQGLWMLNEGGGTLLGDTSGNNAVMSFTGAPTWGSGPLGSQLGGFTTTDYASADSAAAKWATAFPFWMAAVVLTAASPGGMVLALGNSGSNNQVGALWINSSGANTATYWLRNAAGAGPDTTWPATIAWGANEVHMMYGISYASNDHRFGVDGSQVASNTTSCTTPYTFNTCSIGLMRRTSPIFACGSSVIWAAFGQGAVPDFASLWADFWAPYLTPTYRRWFIPAAAATGGPFPWFVEPSMSGGLWSGGL